MEAMSKCLQGIREMARRELDGQGKLDAAIIEEACTRALDIEADGVDLVAESEGVLLNFGAVSAATTRTHVELMCNLYHPLVGHIAEHCPYCNLLISNET